MKNYRVQTCIDSSMYEKLEKFMEDERIETASAALRRILSEFFYEDSM